MSLYAEQHKEGSKQEIVLKKSLCDFIIAAVFHEYLWERGKRQLFTSQGAVVEIFINEDGLHFFFSQNACFLHPFCVCLLRYQDLHHQ